MIEKTEKITIRLLPEEASFIKEQAGIAGISVSEFIRRRALAKSISAKLPVVTKEAVSELRKAMGAAKRIYSLEIVDPAETRRLLDNAEAAIKLITGGQQGN